MNSIAIGLLGFRLTQFGRMNIIHDGVENFNTEPLENYDND